MSTLSPSVRSTLLAGMTSLATDPADAESALASIERWLSDAAVAEYAPLLEELIRLGEYDLLLDSFYRVLPFGTGGRRGPVGLGPNRMNPWTLGTSVQGNLEFMQDRFGAEAPLRVVIASDVRVFRDLRGAFPADMVNPLLGMTSIDLAKQAAAIYSRAGCEVFMAEPGSGRYLATPELSFLIRKLDCQGGLNVSASHNHPDDNGGKFYTEQGAQETPPDDERMVDLVAAVEQVHSWTWEEALASGRVHFVGADLHEEYLDDGMRVLRGTERGARIVFTNLHGVGDQTAGEALERAGFDVHYVPSQRSHDGLFPGVQFRAPNPEYPTALVQATELAQSIEADLVLATDPDADRIGGLARRDDGSFRFLTGNELSSLVAAARFADQPAGKIGVKTEVTTQLFSRVVLAAGGQLVDHLLVGCKYIAQVMRDLETTGVSGSVTGGVDDVLVGTEESHGFLLSANIRDKDAIPPALVLAELAADRKAAGSSLVGALEDLYREHGAVANIQIPLVMTGAVGRGRILAIQEALRANTPSSIDGRPVTDFADRRDEAGIFGPIVSGTDAAARDVLAFTLGPDHRIVIRPSGTEPKTKIYAEAIVPAGDDISSALTEADRQARSLAADFVRQALALIDMELPDAGLHCSPLLGIEARIRFGGQILPQAVAAATEEGAVPSEVIAAVRANLSGLGGDAVGLTAPGWVWWSARNVVTDSARAMLDEVWGA
ncbi:MAG: phospho-sugar mutase [Deltaproteobacteria bacterium]|nr:phospho-sugar mutase [Deltaproteobacteria bacterium]